MRTPVTLLTGFLGSGKTTLLAHLLGAPGYADTAVIINEFGEVALDHLVVARLSENIVELRDGCLCCTIRGDLALSLRELHRARHLGDIPSFARVVVETSGLAEPLPLLHTLMVEPNLRKAYAIDAVVTVVDAVHGAATLATHETAARQVALADILIASKTDLVDPAEHAALAATLAAINPRAERLAAVHGEVPASGILGRTLFEPHARGAEIAQWLAAPHDHADHGSAYSAHVLRHPGALSLAGTSVFLNRIVNQSAEQILRIKGIAGFREKGGRPAVLHAVQNKFYPVAWLADWPDDDHSARFVFIGHRLDTARIDESFTALCV